MDIHKIHGFNFPTPIRFGAGASEELADYLKQNNLKRSLLVTDAIVADLSFFKNIKSQLEQKGISVEVFKDMHKNPIKSDVLAGGEAFHKTNRDCIVGIGGGVALDVARAIALRVNHKRDLFDYDDLIGGDQYVTEEVPHFVTIPTTSGTGSEVGRSAIISEDESKKKRILFSPKLMAKIVFADPLLTMELPAFVTAATGMDALTHNMEAYLAKNFHPMCDGIALEGMQLISESLETATHKPDLKSRSKMLLASLMGAVVFHAGHLPFSNSSPRKKSQQSTGAMGACDGDVILFLADSPSVARDALGNLRVHLAKKLNLIDPGLLAFTWVTEFPLFDYSETEKRFVSTHHPFTSPVLDDVPLIESGPGKGARQGIRPGPQRFRDRGRQHTDPPEGGSGDDLQGSRPE